MDSADKAKKDFFISYTGADEQIASWIAWVLEDARYGVVFQAWDFRQAGSSVIGNIDEAAINCARTIAVVSPEYFASDFTRLEWETAMHSDPTGKEGLLIPVIVRPHEIDGVMKRLAYISFIGLDEEQAETSLLEGVSTDKRFKPATKPEYTLNRSKKKPRFPGTLPDHHNLPRRNPNFSGREQLLLDLRESLTKGQKTALTQQALHGLGGIGKTQLAIEYAYRHSASYEVIWWIRSEEPSTLASDYAALALELDLPEKEEARQSVVVQAVARWLERNGDWLLIFDNARDAESIRNFLPRSASGHVLITSLNPNWKSVGNPLQVEVWERKESVAFLLKRTGWTDEAGANALAEALGDLPLALEQAAAYCDVNQKSFSGYLRLYNTRKAELLSENLLGCYEKTVVTTWSLAFEEIRKVPMAEALLSLSSIVAPDAIPRTLLDKALLIYVERVSEAKALDELVLDKAYRALRSYSLITLDEKFVTVHRLVQSVVRDRMSEDLLAQHRQTMVVALSEQFPQGSYREPSCWPECAILLPHSQVLLENCLNVQDIIWKACGLLMNSMASYYFGKAAYGESEALLRNSLALFESKLGSDHSYVTRSLGNLAESVKAQGKSSEAEQLYRRALKSIKKRYGLDHLEAASTLHNIGLLRQDQGRYADAELWLRRSLDIYEKKYGCDHLYVAQGLSNLGTLLKAQGRYSEAATLLRKAFEIFIRQYALDHSAIATSVNNLGSLLHAQGKYIDAEALYRCALEIWERQLGSEHPHTKIARKNLDELLQLMQGEQ